jgi:carboxylesterase type B
VELGIEPARFRAWPAATWEFTYSESGAALHALDLGFVIGDEFGFALYFQTHAEDWESMQDEFAAFKRSFRPPS